MTKPSPHPPESDVGTRRRRERKLWRNAFLLSVAAHLCLFAFLGHRPMPLAPFAAAGPRELDDRAAGGALQALALSIPPSVPLVPPPVPLPVLDDVEPVDLEPQVLAQVPTVGELGAPGAEGPGRDDRGRGDGGTSGEGLNRMIPPTPRGMIIPPTSDRLKGSEVEVWVFVNEQGRVVADSTRLRPPTSDRGFNERLIEQAAEWIFVPAMRGGQPIATWFPYVIGM